MCTQLQVLVYCWHSYRLSCFASSSLENRSTICDGLAVFKYETRVSSNCYHHASNKDRWHDNSKKKHFTKDNKASTRWQSKPHTRAWEDPRITHAWPTITTGTTLQWTTPKNKNPNECYLMFLAAIVIKLHITSAYVHPAQPLANILNNCTWNKQLLNTDYFEKRELFFFKFHNLIISDYCQSEVPISIRIIQV